MNVHEIITNRFLESLTNGVVPWRKPWTVEGPKNLASGKPYRGVNIFLLGMAGYESPYWVTFKQAQSLGGSVRKGEHGTPVTYWHVRDEENDDGSVERKFALRYYTSFNIAQCDGITAPAAARRPLFTSIDEAERIVNGFAGRPRVVHGGDRACYVPLLDEVHMPARDAFASPPEYYSTLMHELVHATGSHDRLARKGITDPISFASHNYSFEELVAECGAAFLCHRAGIGAATLDNSAAYIASWAKKLKSEPKWIVQAAAQAGKAVDHILGEGVRDVADESEAA